MMKSKRGFTLAEVMVSMFILSALSLALVLIYRSGLTEFSHASGRISLQTRSRVIVDKLIFFLSTASKRDENDEPVPTPATGGAGPEIHFCSFSDLLGNGLITGSTADLNYRSRQPNFYRIYIDENDANRPLYLSQVTAYDGVNPTGAANNPRLLGAQVLSINFARPQNTAIEVQLTICNLNLTTGLPITGDTMRRYQGAPRDNVFTYTLDSAIQLPIFSL